MKTNQINQTVKSHGIDALRAYGESLPDSHLAARAIARFGLSAGARFCLRQGIALEDCLEALEIVAGREMEKQATKNWMPEGVN